MRRLTGEGICKIEKHQTMFGKHNAEQQRLKVQGSVDAVLWRRIDPAHLGIESGSGRIWVSLPDVRTCESCTVS